MQLTIKGAGNRVFTVEVDDSGTVLDLKKAIQESQTDITGNVRLIYSGKLLADAQTLSSYGIASGHSVHMVVARTAESRPPPQPTTTTAPPPQTGPPTAPLPTPPPPAAAPPFFGGGDPFGGGANPFANIDMAAILQNPAFAQMAQQFMANPQALQDMVRQNPFLANIPGIDQAFTDPSAIQAALGMMQQAAGGAAGGADTGAAQAGQAGFGGFPGLPPGVDLGAMLNNPMVQQMMDHVADNPEMLRAMAQANPMTRGFADNPEMLAAAIRQFRSAYGGGQAGGVAAPQAPAPAPLQPAVAGPVDPVLLGRLLGGPVPDGADSQIAYNPVVRGGLAQVVQGIQICRANGLRLLGDLGEADRLLAQAAGVLGVGIGQRPPVVAPAPGVAPVAQVPPAAPVQLSPEQRFGRQLQQMEEMGFGDRQRNIEALIATAGNVNNAIEWLLTQV
jgi:ubiquilin